MKRFASQLGRALIVGGMLCGLAATPAMADHDHHNDRHRRHYYSDHHSYWDHSSGYYRDYDYDRYYYSSGPRVSIYAPPVYVPPPPPPSFGLSLVFPFHHH